MNKKKIIVIFSLSFGLLICAGTAQAYNWTGFLKEVGAFNGSAYTAYKQKDVSRNNIGLDMYDVEGDYTVDVRPQTNSGRSGEWAQRVGDNDWVSWSSYNTSDVSERLQFSNDIFTPVQVDVRGQWRN